MSKEESLNNAAEISCLMDIKEARRKKQMNVNRELN